MAELIPIGRNDMLEIRYDVSRSGKPIVHLNVLTTDNVRSYRRTEKGFPLEVAILAVVVKAICEVAPTVRSDLIKTIQRSG